MRPWRSAVVSVALCLAVSPLSAAQDDPPRAELQELIELVTVGKPVQRVEAAQRLGEMGPAAADALQALAWAVKCGDPLRLKAAWAMARIGPTEEILLWVVADDFGRDFDGRRGADALLDALGSEHAYLAPALLTKLDHKAGHVQERVARALVRMIPVSPEALNGLCDYARNPSKMWVWRINIAEAFAAERATHPEVIQTLIDVILAQEPPTDEYDFPGYLRARFVDALLTIDSQSPKVREALRQAAKTDPSDQTRTHISRKLQELGEDEVAIANVMEVLGSDDPFARAQATLVVKEQSERFLPALLSALATEDGIRLVTVAGILGDLGPAASNAIPVLSERIKTVDSPAAAELIWALGGFGVDVVPQLLEYVEDEATRAAGAIALERVGRDALPQMERALDEADKAQAWSLRRAAEAIRSTDDARTSAWAVSNGLAVRAALSRSRVAPGQGVVLRATIRNVTGRDLPIIVRPQGLLSQGRLKITAANGEAAVKTRLGTVSWRNYFGAAVLKPGESTIVARQLTLTWPPVPVGARQRWEAELMLKEFPEAWLVDPGTCLVSLQLQNENDHIPASRAGEPEDVRFVDRYGVPGWIGSVSTPPLELQIIDGSE